MKKNANGEGSQNVEKAEPTSENASVKAIASLEKFGGYLSKYVGGSLEQAMGILEDKLKYMRWERRARLMSRANDFIESESLGEPTKVLALKYAIPLLSAALIEEDNHLQDIWAKLLVNFTNRNSGIEASRTYIDILERLSSLEVSILQSIYISNFENIKGGGVFTKGLPDIAEVVPEKMSDKEREQRNSESEPSINIILALDNLNRLGVLKLGLTWGMGYHYERVLPTHLGKAFYDACTLPSEKKH